MLKEVAGDFVEVSYKAFPSWLSIRH